VMKREIQLAVLRCKIFSCASKEVRSSSMSENENERSKNANANQQAIALAFAPKKVLFATFHYNFSSEQGPKSSTIKTSSFRTEKKQNHAFSCSTHASTLLRHTHKHTHTYTHTHLRLPTPTAADPPDWRAWRQTQLQAGGHRCHPGGCAALGALVPFAAAAATAAVVGGAAAATAAVFGVPCV